MWNKILKKIYIVVFIVIMAVPGIWTLFQDKTTIGNEDAKDMSGATYLTFSEKFDDYFSSNFGFRSQLINANNLFMNLVFNQSGEDSVIIGDEDWLFYKSALHDYTGSDVLSDSDIAKIVRVLEMADTYVSDLGADLVFSIAPNKMEIYGEYMPYYYIENTDDGNYEKLIKALGDTTVDYTDLKTALKESAKESAINIYHKLDSHWNNIGASVAYENIMGLTDFEYTDYSSISYEVKKDFTGDLYEMLYPDGTLKDQQMKFDNEQTFEYTSNFRGNDDMLIETHNDAGSDSVLMFRDSFGNALYSFFANDFKDAEFSRALPYNLEEAKDRDLVVMEIVERNISNLLLYPPIMEAPAVEISATPETVSDTNATVELESKGNYNLITIESEDIPSDCVDIFVKNNDEIYQAYPTALNGDACLYLATDKEVNLSGFTVYYEMNGVLYQIENLT